jgi:hypothetical protein
MRAAARPGTLNSASIFAASPVAIRVPIHQGSPIMTSSSRTTITRRTALAGLGAGSLGLALTAARPAAAQDAADLAGHPLVGTWLVMTPGGVVPQTFSPDGSTVGALPPSYVDPMFGVTLQGTLLGRWEATGERSGHFTVVQALSAPDGTYLGTSQFEADPEVSDDGRTWSAGKPQRVIVRDAGNNVIFDQVVTPDAPIPATRMGATMDSVVLPVVTPAAATPTA